MLRRYHLVLMAFLTSVSYAQHVSLEQAYQTAMQFFEGGQSAQRAPVRGGQSLHIPGSVKDIAAAAFCTCHGIKTVTVDESNPYYYSPQGSNVIIERSNGRLVQTFNNSVVPSEGIFIIGKNAFYELDSITSVRLPETVTAIEDKASGFPPKAKCQLQNDA